MQYYVTEHPLFITVEMLNLLLLIMKLRLVVTINYIRFNSNPSAEFRGVADAISTSCTRGLKTDAAVIPHCKTHSDISTVRVTLALFISVTS